MDFDLNTPLAQSIIQSGQSSGRTPLEIAAAVARTYQENGGRPGGAPGDNGISYGAMQWNRDRIANLRNFASQQGLAWNDPKAQGPFIWHEMDTSEKPAGDRLRAATDPKSAAYAMMSYVRPKNWNIGYDNLNHGAQTEQMTGDIYKALTSGQTGGSSVNPSNPSSTTDSGPLQQGRSVAAGTSSGPGGMINLGGGSAASSGSPSKNWGNTLSDIGMIMMAMGGNTAGANALAKMAENDRERAQWANKVNQWSGHSMTNNGKYMIQQDGRGNTRLVPIPAEAQGLTDYQQQRLDQQKDKADAAQDLAAQRAELKQQQMEMPTNQESKRFEENDAIIQAQQDTAEAISKLQQALKEGKLKVNPAARTAAEVYNYTGNSTEESANLKEQVARTEQAIASLVKQQKGPARQFEFTQTKNQLFPSGGSYDTVTVMDGLNRMQQLVAGQEEPAMRSNAAIAEMKPKITGGIMDEQGNPIGGKSLREYYARMKDRTDDANQDLREGYTITGDPNSPNYNPDDNPDSLVNWRKRHFRGDTSGGGLMGILKRNRANQ